MKIVLQILLVTAIFVLGYYCVESINKPVRFQKEYELRKNMVIERLIDIRSAQSAFRSVNQKFTGSFDSLIYFIKNDSLPLVRMEGSLTDSMLAEGVTEIMALRMGIIKRDTIRISVKDSLFHSKPWIVDSIKYVPFSGGKTFEMGSGVINTVSGVKVPVFEAKTHNNVYLSGLERQEVINLNDRSKKLEKYAGLKVGSLAEANNNIGNWE